MSGGTYDGHGAGGYGVDRHGADGHGAHGAHGSDRYGAHGGHGSDGSGSGGSPADGSGAGGDADGRDEQQDDTSFVRPFIITGGRSEPLQAGLRLETLVVAVGEPDDELAFERRHIVAVCERPTTVAEVADRVGVPLGVAKVLISDLVDAGRLACRQPAELPLQMLERIRDHVRAL